MILGKLSRLNQRFFPAHVFHGPRWIVLGVNNVCNLHCRMCDVGTETVDTNFARNLIGTRPLNMPKELLENVIDQVAGRWPDARLGYAFTEPLIYPYLIETLSYAGEKHVAASVTTNGLTLSKLAADLCRTGVEDIFVSLDGPEPVHDFIRGKRGSFRRAIDGIEALLREKRRPRISVFCVITEWNTSHLKRFADFFMTYPLEQLGFMHPNFTPDHVAGSHNERYGERYPATASNVQEADPGKTDLTVLWKEIQNIRQSNAAFPITFSPDVRNMEQLELYYRRPDRLFGRRCVDVNRNMMVKSDGSVIPAHGRCYNYPIGNVYESDLSAIWNSPGIRRFRSDLNKAGGLFPACSRCCSAFGE